MATTSGMTALDVVVRERAAIDALPSVVRTIRQFAQEPFALRLQRALWTHPIAVAARAIEQLVRDHAEDMRIEALESGCDTSCSWSRNLPGHVQSALVWKAIAFGAQAGSVPIVAWACSAPLPPGGHVYGAMAEAIARGRFEIVKLLYEAAPPSRINDDRCMCIAAAHGRMEIVQWLYANRSDKQDRFPPAAAPSAIQNSHLDALKWICATHVPDIAVGMLVHAAVHDQQHIMDWCYDNMSARERWSDVSHHFLHVLRSRGKLEHLVWLHEKFPDASIARFELEWHTTTTPSDCVKVCELVKAFPQRYAQQGVALEYLYEISGGVVAVRALWHALRRGFLDVVVWMFEHEPELRTRERLLEMRDASLKQAPSNIRGDIEQVTRWLNAALESASVAQEPSPSTELVESCRLEE